MNYRLRPHCCLLLVLAIGLLWRSTAMAQPPPGYYNSAEGLTGQALRAALHNIIANQAPVSYNGLWSAFQATDAKPGNKVWDMYSDNPGGTTAYVYTFGTDQCGQYTAEGNCYNREHSFPQSWFNGQSPMYTDLFHIYPVDGFVNNKRGNLPYGDVGSADWTSTNHSKTGLCIDPGFNGTVFEPNDAYKGDLARSYLYMMTRYYGQMTGWSSPVVQNGDLIGWNRAVMLQWNDMDPVSAKEVARNNAVYALQGNRNPFIDRPEWVQAIWGTPSGISGEAPAGLVLQGDEAGLHIQRTTSRPGTLRVYDATGRTVLVTAIQGLRADIGFSGPRGIYIAEITSPQDRSVQRFAW